MPASTLAGSLVDGWRCHWPAYSGDKPDYLQPPWDIND